MVGDGRQPLHTNLLSVKSNPVICGEALAVDSLPPTQFNPSFTAEDRGSPSTIVAMALRLSLLNYRLEVYVY